jgi:hypothetical protein
MPHRGNLFDSVVFLMEALVGIEPTGADFLKKAPKPINHHALMKY